MSEEQLHKVFGRARIDDRIINELLGLAHGITADGKVTQEEAEYLEKWLAANTAVADNPIVSNLLEKVGGYLEDGFLDQEEAADLQDTLSRFAGGDFELGELLKSTSLPLDVPTPTIEIPDKRFCFTGTFALGSRKDCEQTVAENGGKSGSLTKQTDFLVIGIYATDSWAHSSYGRKIEKAMGMKDKGHKIAIIGELHWLEAVR